ncbi:hypothetical protein CB1_000548011 [Camelus ferus]|nr:hypothetical protein CB1_000548011 [Camelus ferus]
MVPILEIGDGVTENVSHGQKENLGSEQGVPPNLQVHQERVHVNWEQEESHVQVFNARAEREQGMISVQKSPGCEDWRRKSSVLVEVDHLGKTCEGQRRLWNLASSCRLLLVGTSQHRTFRPWTLSQSVEAGLQAEHLQAVAEHHVQQDPRVIHVAPAGLKAKGAGGPASSGLSVENWPGVLKGPRESPQIPSGEERPGDLKPSGGVGGGPLLHRPVEVVRRVDILNPRPWVLDPCYTDPSRCLVFGFDGKSEQRDREGAEGDERKRTDWGGRVAVLPM